jgi:hypothetical protein
MTCLMPGRFPENLEAHALTAACPGEVMLVCCAALHWRGGPCVQQSRTVDVNVKITLQRCRGESLGRPDVRWPSSVWLYVTAVRALWRGAPDIVALEEIGLPRRSYRVRRC